MSDEDGLDVRELLQEQIAPDEAMDAYPDECAHCGAGADAYWVPNDYHERPPEARDPGVCTECGHHFGTGDW